MTFDEYDAFCDYTGRSKPEDKNWGRRKRPVIHVSWYDAIEYCNWLSKREGFTPFYRMNGCGISENWCADGYLLPTEAEWEHAAREGGKKVRFGNGKDRAVNDAANFNARPAYRQSYLEEGMHRCEKLPVKLFAPNTLGLYDMAGNVWRWCNDWHERDYYSRSPADNPKGGSGASGCRAIRGGSWDNWTPAIVRAAFRYAEVPERVDRFITGFRLCRGLPR